MILAKSGAFCKAILMVKFSMLSEKTYGMIDIQAWSNVRAYVLVGQLAMA
jgi:hypothetical protein